MMNSRFIGGTAPRPGTNRCDSCGAPLPERAPRVDQMTFAEYQEHRERLYRSVFRPGRLG